MISLLLTVIKELMVNMIFVVCLNVEWTRIVKVKYAFIAFTVFMIA